MTSRERTFYNILNTSQQKILENIYKLNGKKISYTQIIEGAEIENTDRRYIHARIQSLIKRKYLKHLSRSTYQLTNLAKTILNLPKHAK